MPRKNMLERSFDQEVTQGERFTFGENWREFMAFLNEQQVVEAEASLGAMLETETLEGKSFLDVGSGSGLFSLSARRMGAVVHSFDYDPSSVWCTRELRRRFFRDDPQWTVEEGSVLDSSYLQKLDTFDIVYSWGVLHHTGDMWRALDLVSLLVKPGGKLFIAIYNDQGRRSRYWRIVKKTYCSLPRLLKPLILYPVGIILWGPRTISDIAELKPFHTWRNYYRNRGMSPWRDVVDWVGGYPFEVAKPEQVSEFCRQRGLNLLKLKPALGLGNNQFLFHRLP